MSVGRTLFYAGLMTGLFALSIRYTLHIQEQMALGKSFIDALAHLFSFFTIVMNTLVVLCYLASIPFLQKTLAFFRRPFVVGTAIAGILIVMIVYHLLLSATHNPTGISVLTNLCLHYIAPVLFPLWWFFESRKGTMNWQLVPAMTIIPILYLVWIFSRGAITNEYPYGFLNVAEKGVAGVAPTLIVITLLFIVFGSIVVFFDKRYTENP
ncbi:MAG: Pr6Pr family membrane protein [Pseudomonadota bacterium]